jgi:uncharacterized protein (UPF0335 family)
MAKQPTVSSDSVAQDQIRAFIERIERLEEEKQAIADDIKEVYAEAKGNGFDTKVLRQIIRIRKQDAAERMEQEALLELYMAALGMAVAPRDEGETTPRRTSSVQSAIADLRALAERDGTTISIIHDGKETIIADGKVKSSPQVEALMMRAVETRSAVQVPFDFEGGDE